MPKRQSIASLLMIFGILLMMYFSIQHQNFHSGILGIAGSLCVVAAYLVFNWAQWKAGNRRVRRLTWLLSALCLLLVILRVAEALV